MCGIIALLLANPSAQASPELHDGLSILQHRGQDAAGIITCSKGRLYQVKSNGMVRDVFSPQKLMELQGNMGVGHVRYPTAGSSSTSEAQPFYVNSPYGIVFAHNGNLTNAKELKDFLDKDAHRHINTSSDSELLLNIFANNLQETGKVRINEQDIFNALGGLAKQCYGGYACVAMITGFGIIGFRDPHGIRPCVFGKRSVGSESDYMIASESVALQSLGMQDIQDIQPGEAIIMTKSGVTRQRFAEAKQFTPCIFEYVYFSRPDSIIDKVSVYKSRLAMGEALADQVKRVLGKDMDVDVVIPVPDTSRVAALQCAYFMQIPYREGFIKNRYIGRTFIMPGQSLRKKSVRRKLNPMAQEFSGKNVLLVDDSIVRGTTSKEIVQMARDSGAKKVYFASCAPAIRYPNVYGIDMPSTSELIAHGKDDVEVAKAIDADVVIYQRLEDLIESCRKFNREIESFEVSVFTGDYVTGNVTKAYLEQIDRERRGVKAECAEETIGLFNNFRK